VTTGETTGDGTLGAGVGEGRGCSAVVRASSNLGLACGGVGVADVVGECDVLAARISKAFL
jgi:hypothetical protein